MRREKDDVMKPFVHDRPSRHGAFLGEALALMAAAGRRALPSQSLPDPCLTCAFRAGTAPNQCAGTVMEALNSVMGIDDAEFACHHGMVDGRPTRPCSGYAAARAAPFPHVKELLASCAALLQRVGVADDEVRRRYDAWLVEVDPSNEMDVYQQARAYAARTRP